MEVCSQQLPPVVHGRISPEHLVQANVDSHWMLTNFSLYYMCTRQVIAGMDHMSMSLLYTAPDFAPEKITVQSDLYALLATAYYAVTGTNPASERGNINQAQWLNPTVSPYFNAILMKGLHPVASQRYQWPSELRKDLLEALSARNRLVAESGGQWSTTAQQEPSQMERQLFEGMKRSAPEFVTPIPPSQAPSDILTDQIDVDHQKTLHPLPEGLPPMQIRNDALTATYYLVSILICLRTLTRRIGKGDTSARAMVIGQDEIAMVATAMNDMLDRIVLLIQEAQARHNGLQAQVEKLVDEVSGVGEGDLRIQAEVGSDTLGVLADSFNYMVEELSNLIIRVKTVAQEIESSTTNTSERMTQLVANADWQLQQIAIAAGEVEQMTNTSHQVAERTQVLYEVATEARHSAYSGRTTVQQTITGMEHIHDNVQDTASKVHLLGERSREINEIVTVIAGIASQTNRLALDATIQAAMAGENGKGFGAVAADIRRLAERTKEQTTMISQIIRNVREDIEAVAISMHDTQEETSVGATLVQQTGSTLGTIFAVVEQQAKEIETINHMARQQLHSSRSVVHIIQDVSNVTQNSSNSTRQTAYSMKQVARQAEQLQTSVETFKLKKDVLSQTGGIG